MTDYSEQIKLAIKATVFYSSTTYSCFGKQPLKIPPRIERVMTPGTARNYALTQLQSKLYSDFYVSRAGAANAFGDSGGLAGSARFAESLSAANAGVGHWENGWHVLETTPGDVLVRKNALTLCVPSNCLSPADQCLAAGTTVRLRLPKEWLRISPGYYSALSDQADDAGEEYPLVRLYWNIQAEGTEILVRTATRWLNEARLFFKLKLLNNPTAYSRCDAGVLYFRKHEYSAIADVLARIHPRIACYLRTGVPVFTKPLAPGIGLAEDPGTEESFGQNRCRPLAEGMIRAYEQRARSLDRRLQIVAESYAGEGISLTHPYLNRNSTDGYTHPW